MNSRTCCLQAMQQTSAHTGFHTGFFVGGGNLVRACAIFFPYCALSAISRQATPSYPYILKWKLVKTQRKVTQYHKAITQLGGGGGGDFRWGGEIPGRPPPPSLFQTLPYSHLPQKTACLCSYNNYIQDWKLFGIVKKKSET